MTQKIHEEIIMGKIIEALKNQMSDELFIEYPVGLNTFTLKQEDGR